MSKHGRRQSSMYIEPATMTLDVQQGINKRVLRSELNEVRDRLRSVSQLIQRMQKVNRGNREIMSTLPLTMAELMLLAGFSREEIGVIFTQAVRESYDRR